MNKIIAVGSVDGVLTSAALIRFLANQGLDSQIMFTQAFTCQETLEFIKSGDYVWLVDLAVNNRDLEYTRTFIEGLFESRASLCAIVDEHNSDDWHKIIARDFELQVYPESRSEMFPSSGAVLRKTLSPNPAWDDYCTTLTQYADEADQANFIGIGSIVNKAVKANIKDQNRRAYLANHFAVFAEPDEQISQWVSDYETIEANMADIVRNAQDYGKYIYLDTRDKQVDMTTLATTVYRKFPDALVVIARGQAYDKNKGGVIPCYSFMASTNAPNNLNVQELVGVDGFGFAKKFNVEDKDFEEALAILKDNL